MIHTIFSDVHADENGLSKLLKHTSYQAAEHRICLGDAINANEPQSAKSYYERVRGACDDMILGNHEAALTGACDVSVFNPTYQDIISEAKAHFEATDPDFLQKLAKLPTQLQFGEIEMRHASFNPTEPWHHVRYTEDVQDQANYLPARLQFIGHGHIPFIAWLADDGFWYYQRQIYDKEFKLTPDTKYVINAGSVLGSREMRHFERTFLTFDDVNEIVRFYNLEAA